MNKNYRIETIALHGGQSIDETKSRAVPVYRTSSYVFDSAEHGADLFALKQKGFIYTRIMNPTQEVLETRVAMLENGKAALALASGTSAIFYSIINVCKAGDEFISASNLYGGTYTMFDAILPQFGITCKMVPYNDYSAYEDAINDKTRAIFIESIGNPTLGVPDFEKVAKIASKHHFPLIVDNTFATPYHFRPIDYGANIVVHSLTKWLGGHGTAIGGIVIDAGNFDWTDKKFSLYNEPDAGYHGLRFAHDLGDANPLAFILRMRLVALRNLGAAISPDNAWIFLQGLETFPLRMQRHSDNAMKVAQFLKSHINVAWVRYPGLEGDSSYEVATRYFIGGFGGMVVFGIKGGYESAVKFINGVKLFSHLANVGDAKSLVLHPASTSHSQLSEEQQRQAGITPDLIRLSIGIEHSDDIIEALQEALQ
ncbi:MAG: O-acetylhomoserine aminocarboxypropyltransferase/cysteine synthase [Spirochaetes bacterium]|nr:O-acetylhomoserine aminocarboxypropyltransferase/cysteine synthase [Spirochaetota bacterium]